MERPDPDLWVPVGSDWGDLWNYILELEKYINWLQGKKENKDEH